MDKKPSQTTISEGDIYLTASRICENQSRLKVMSVDEASTYLITLFESLYGKFANLTNVRTEPGDFIAGSGLFSTAPGTGEGLTATNPDARLGRAGAGNRSEATTDETSEPSEMDHIVLSIRTMLQNSDRAAAKATEHGLDPDEITLGFQSLHHNHSSVWCLECGKSAKMLTKRHLKNHGLTPDEYKAKYGIPSKTTLMSEEQSESRTKTLLASRYTKTKAEAIPAQPRRAHRSVILVNGATPPSPVLENDEEDKEEPGALTAAKTALMKAIKNKQIDIPAAYAGKSGDELLGCASLRLKDDSVICLLCGQSHDTLLRHLKVKHNMDAEEYKQLMGIVPGDSLSSMAYKTQLEPNSIHDEHKDLEEVKNELLEAIRAKRIEIPSRYAHLSEEELLGWASLAFSENGVICLYCGRNLSSLGNHLRTIHHISAEKYRQEFNISPDDSLVSQNAPQALGSQKAEAVRDHLLKKVSNGEILIPEEYASFSGEQLLGYASLHASDDAVYCLECGLEGQILVRHLRVQHNLRPDEYRKKWSLLHSEVLASRAICEQRKKHGATKKRKP